MYVPSVGIFWVLPGVRGVNTVAPRISKTHKFRIICLDRLFKSILHWLWLPFLLPFSSFFNQKTVQTNESEMKLKSYGIWDPSPSETQLFLMQNALFLKRPLHVSVPKIAQKWSPKWLHLELLFSSFFGSIFEALKNWILDQKWPQKSPALWRREWSQIDTCPQGSFWEVPWSPWLSFGCILGGFGHTFGTLWVQGGAFGCILVAPLPTCPERNLAVGNLD